MTSKQQKPPWCWARPGGIGGELARTLIARGWRRCAPCTVIRPGLPKPIVGVAWIRGDSHEPDRCDRRGRGCRRDCPWRQSAGLSQIGGGWPCPCWRNTIAAARTSGARIFFPGTVYNFGPDAFPLVAEDAPQRPLTRKGAIRVEMEARLRDATATGIRVLILRAGDYFGADAARPNSWFSAALVKTRAGR